MLPRSLESALLAIVLAAVVTDCGDCMLLGIDTLAPPRHFEVERMTATNVTLQWDPPLLSQTDLPLRGYAFAFNRTKEIELAGYRHIVAWNYLEKDERTKLVRGLMPSTEYRFYLSTFTIKNNFTLLSPTISLIVSTPSGGMPLTLIAFPLGTICIIGLLGTVVYTNVKQQRKLSTISIG